ncbi:MAG: HAMP domain-containing histidine kinase [Lachnospiraceae bacterium]|nr:HAMP domain-containing histidine kinase [Lachnospiraceae bacterium]
MKKFWNWKTALMGLVTALFLMLVTMGAYLLYCAYVTKTMEDAQVVVSTVEEVSENSSVVISKSGDSDVNVEMDTTPSVEAIKSVYGYMYVLYKEYCDTQRRRAGKEPYVRYQDLIYDPVPTLEIPSAFQNERESYQSNYDDLVSQARDNVERRLSGMEASFYEFNNRYDYWIFDKDHNKETLTNTSRVDASSINMTKYAFLYRVDFDEHGVATVSDKNQVAGDREKLRKNLISVLHEKPKNLLSGEVDTVYSEDFFEKALEKATTVKYPENCSIIIGITWEKFNNFYGIQTESNEWEYVYTGFQSFAVTFFSVAILLVGAIWGGLWLNPRSEKKREGRILAKAPLELVIALISLVHFGNHVLRIWLADMYMSYRTDYVSACLYIFFLHLVTWYVGGCLGEIRILGVRGYLQRRFLSLLCWRWLRNCFKKVYDDYCSLNLGMNLRKKVILLIVLNAFIVSLFCCVWLLGIIGVILYSICLYFLVMSYIIAVQRDYQQLRRMTKEMAEGNLKYEPEESLGLFEPAKEDLVNIRNGFDKAVQEEVKSHKLKTELITNVSHDLKTPLTAIITYVNLLKEKNLTEEQRAQYVDTLDKKSLRLKRLIEDLFEVSKANSGNVQLNIQNCDLANLIKQCFYEVEDKLKEKGLTTRLTFPEEKVVLRLDGEKTYRIYENLFNNIVKYAMAGTRVYVAMTEDKDHVYVTVKNITEAELYVPAQELTERFVRGDASRGTVEGSGLGLAIVRSFTELQGGKLELEIDGDLFMVTTIWVKP